MGWPNSLLAGPCAKCNNLFPTRILSYKVVIINREDVLPLGNDKTEAATSGVLEGNTACLGSQDSIHVIPIIELVVEPLWHLNHLRWIFVLYCYQMGKTASTSPRKFRFQMVGITMPRSSFNVAVTGVTGCAMVSRWLWPENEKTSGGAGTSGQEWWR
ncbi:hypothetical protein AAG906_024733 [Vitis piasezkii]